MISAVRDDVSRTLVVAVVLIALSSVLAAVFSLGGLQNYVFTTSHVASAEGASPARIRAAVVQVSGLRPDQVELKPMAADAPAFAACGAAALTLQVAFQATTWASSDIQGSALRAAQAEGLGQECAGMHISIQRTPGPLISPVGSAAVALLILILMWRSRRGHLAFGVHWYDWTPRMTSSAAVAWGAVAAVAMIAMGSALSRLAGVLGTEADWSNVPGTRRELLAMLPLTVVAAPIFEEFVFRAWMLERLARAWRPWIALLASSAAFAVVHAPDNAILASGLFSLGLVLGLLWWRTRSFLACVVAHALYNAAVTAGVWYSTA